MNINISLNGTLLVSVAVVEISSAPAPTRGGILPPLLREYSVS